MDVKLLPTIAAVVVDPYDSPFRCPVQDLYSFSDFAATFRLILRFCGAVVLCGGVIVWFARDFWDWDAVRGGSDIASVAGLAVRSLITVWATMQGWLNANAWGSAVVLFLAFAWGRVFNSCLASDEWCVTLRR